MPSYENVPLLGQPSSVTRSDKESATEEKGPFVRLLQCFDCRTTELLPDFQGRADNDVILHEIDSKHGGHEEEIQRRHNRALHRVPQRVWERPKMREAIVKRMWEGTGFSPSVYAVRDTLKEDAVKCFIKHRRSVPCIDYRDDSKRLGNPQREARENFRKEFGRDMREISGGPRVYLCQYCPVEVKVQQKKQDLYGDDYGN